jgi:prepilin-type N-terminal cleavage/methylation domain-containing protein
MNDKFTLFHGFKKKHPKGFTLLELILVMVLLGIAAVMVTPFVGNVLINLIEGREFSHRETQAFLALERFVRDVRGAINVDESEFPGKMTIDDGDLIYEIDGGVLYLNDQVLVKNLAVDTTDGSGKSEISRNSSLTDFSFFTLKLVLTIGDNTEFELTASAVQRNSL